MNVVELILCWYYADMVYLSADSSNHLTATLPGVEAIIYVNKKFEQSSRDTRKPIAFQVQ